MVLLQNFECLVMKMVLYNLHDSAYLETLLQNKQAMGKQPYSLFQNIVDKAIALLLNQQLTTSGLVKKVKITLPWQWYKLLDGVLNGAGCPQNKKKVISI